LGAKQREEHVSAVTAVQNIVHGWHDLPIKYFLLFGGDVDENREHIKSSMFFLCSRSFCGNSALTCTSGLLHCIENMVFSMPWLPPRAFTCGKKPFSLKLFMNSEMYFGVEF
jgi:hypothetical protein